MTRTVAFSWVHRVCVLPRAYFFPFLPFFFIRTRSHDVKGMYVRYVSMDYSNEVRTRSRHIRACHTSSAVSLNRNLLSRANILNHLRCPEIGRIHENFNKARAGTWRKKILCVFRLHHKYQEFHLSKQCGEACAQIIQTMRKIAVKILYYRFRYRGYTIYDMYRDQVNKTMCAMQFFFNKQRTWKGQREL